MSHDDRPEEQCLLIIQTSMSTDLATKIQIHGSQERISWYSCLQALLDQAGVYELHYAIRESEIPNTVQKSGIDPTVPMDILISFRTLQNHASFRINPLPSALNTSSTTVTAQIFVPDTNNLELRGLHGDTIELHHFSFSPSTASEPKSHALFERRLKTYIDLMMDSRRSDAGYGAHLYGPIGKVAVLFSGGVKKSKAPAETRLIGWNGGWVDSSNYPQDKGKEETKTERGGSEYVLILGWQGAEEARANTSFLDKLPAKGLRKRRAGAEDAKRRWGQDLGMKEGDWIGGETDKTEEVFWPLCTNMAGEGVRSERYIECVGVYPEW